MLVTAGLWILGKVAEKLFDQVWNHLFPDPKRQPDKLTLTITTTRGHVVIEVPVHDHTMMRMVVDDGLSEARDFDVVGVAGAQLLLEYDNTGGKRRSVISDSGERLNEE